MYESIVADPLMLARCLLWLLLWLLHSLGVVFICITRVAAGSAARAE